MRIIGILLTALAAAFVMVSLSGCTSAPATRTTAQTAPEQMSNVERYRRVVDIHAERKNVEVYWVNPPKEEDLDEYTDEDL